jgi:hypothetical protein
MTYICAKGYANNVSPILRVLFIFATLLAFEWMFPTNGFRILGRVCKLSWTGFCSQFRSHLTVSLVVEWWSQNGSNGSCIQALVLRVRRAGFEPVTK